MTGQCEVPFSIRFGRSESRASTICNSQLSKMATVEEGRVEDDSPGILRRGIPGESKALKEKVILYYESIFKVNLIVFLIMYFTVYRLNCDRTCIKLQSAGFYLDLTAAQGSDVLCITSYCKSTFPPNRASSAVRSQSQPFLFFWRRRLRRTTFNMLHAISATW